MSEFRFDPTEPISDEYRLDRSSFRVRRKRMGLATLGIIGGGGVVIAGGVALIAGLRDGVNTKEETVTVCDKEYVPGSEGTGEYRVYVADESGERHTRRVVDTLIVGGTRFNSADTYAELDRGVTYDITTSGYRIGIFSQFPNIIEVEKLPEEQQVNYC